jgi:hypothetical protein
MLFNNNIARQRINQHVFFTKPTGHNRNQDHNLPHNIIHNSFTQEHASLTHTQHHPHCCYPHIKLVPRHQYNTQQTTQNLMHTRKQLVFPHKINANNIMTLKAELNVENIPITLIQIHIILTKHATLNTRYLRAKAHKH